MCDPISMIGLAISAASQVVGFMGQMQQYDAAAEHYKANAANARTAAINRWESLSIRANQEGAAANQKKFEANIETAQAAATAETAAGEGGVSGLSVSALMRDIYAKGARHNSAVDQNLQMTRSYLEGEMDATQTNAQSQINAVPIPEKPNFAATLVNIFGAGLNSYSGYQQRAA